MRYSRAALSRLKGPAPQRCSPKQLIPKRRALFYCATFRPVQPLHMTQNEWAQTDWLLVGRLEIRAAQIRTTHQAADALQSCARLIPARSLWKLWPSLLLLTIAGVSPRHRPARVELAKQTSVFLTSDETLTLFVQEMRQGHGPGYLRTLLTSKPGACWSRLRYPLQLSCGRLLDRQGEEEPDLQSVLDPFSVRCLPEAPKALSALSNGLEEARIQATWREAREVLSHPDATPAIRARLREHIALARLG